MNTKGKQKYSVFYINLDKDSDRKEFMDNQLTALGFSFNRTQGILGDSIVGDSNYYDEKRAILLNGAPLSKGELGCAASHILIYRKMIEENIAQALIFEDDVILPHDFKIVVDKVMSSKVNFDYLLFDYPPVGFWFIKYWCKMTWSAVKNDPRYAIYAVVKAPYIIGLSLYEGFRDRFIPAGPKSFLRPLYFAGAYFLTNEGAKKMLSLSDPITYPADRLPNQARIKAGLIFRGYTPLIVKQDRSTFISNIA